MAQAAAESAQWVHEEFAAGRALQGAGDLDGAKAAFGEILAKLPQHTDSLIMLASIAYQQGEDIQAGAYLDRAIKIYEAILGPMPKLTTARGPLVNLLLAQGRREEAENHAANLEFQVRPVRAEPKEFLRRLRLGRERGLPPILLNTLPKTASESIWNKLAEGLTLGQGHISLGLFPDCCLLPFRVEAIAEGGFIAKEHICPTPFNLATLAEKGLNHVVCNVRDPRQATLSWAHFVKDDVSMRMIAPIWRKIVPPASLPKSDFGAYLDWCIDNYLPLVIDFVSGWMEVEKDEAQPVRVLFQTFEDFRSDPDQYFARILEFYEIDPALFVKEAEAETVHLRRGETDEWREVFSAEQKKRAWKLIPNEMAERFGWTA